jgi:hypothetical protein
MFGNQNNCQNQISFITKISQIWNLIIPFEEILNMFYCFVSVE